MQNKTIKEVYTEIDSWLKKQDSKKIKFLESQREYGDTSDLSKLQKTLRYHYILHECKDKLPYIFGDKTITIKEISQYMINSMGDYGPEKGESKEDFEENCHHSGYADMAMFKDIKSFWKSLDKESIMSIANGSADEDYEIDLDGYRCYFLSHSNVYPLIFNYVYYTLKKTPENLDNEYDTLDAIDKFFPPKEIFLPSAREFEALFSDKNNEQSEENCKNFFDTIKDLVEDERYVNEPTLKEKIAVLTLMIKNK